MNNGSPSSTRSARLMSRRLATTLASISLQAAGCWVSGLGLLVLVAGMPEAAIAQEDLPDLSPGEEAVAPQQPPSSPDASSGPTLEDLLQTDDQAVPVTPDTDNQLNNQRPPVSDQDNPQPVAQPVPPGAIPVERVPSLTPSPEPRYERPLIAEPNNTGIDLDFGAYHLGPGDSIFVSVQRYPDLSFQATLDLQGNIIVPLEGSLSLEGLSLEEAETFLFSTYNKYVRLDEEPPNQRVDITLVARRSVEVTILGAVQRPGFYPLTDPSVATALLTAGGATRTSDLRAIQVQRQLRRGNVLIAEETLDVDLFTPLKNGSPLPDVRLEDGDVLIIPELDPSQLDEYDSYLVARSTLAQPIINVRFLNYAGGRGGIGTLNLNNGSSFLDAISLLAVNPDNANLGDVALIRYDPESGEAITISLDAKSAIMGDITQNPPLQDSDVIVVGRNLIGRISYALQTVTRPFRDVLGFSNFFDDFLNNGLFER